MHKIFCFYISIFLSFVTLASEQLLLDSDLALLKSHLSSLEVMIAFSKSEDALIKHVDSLIIEVERRVSALEEGKPVYLEVLTGIKEARLRVRAIQESTYGNIDKFSRDLEPLSYENSRWLKGFKERSQRDEVDNKIYLYDLVICQGEYSLSEWRAIPLHRRRMQAIRCSIERERDEVYAMFKEYKDSDPALEGRLTIMLTIQSSGLITVSDYESKLPESLVDSILSHFKNIKMPVLDSKGVDIEYTFKFLR